MRFDPVELSAYPEVLSKKQLRRACHISQRTAHYLLETGLIPNRHSNRYWIRKEDVLAFMQSSDKLLVPEAVCDPDSKWGKPHAVRLLPPVTVPQAVLRDYYIRQSEDWPDVLDVDQICAVTGYNRRTVAQWVRRGRLRFLMRDSTYHVPKGWLIDYLCSDWHNNTNRKSPQHLAALWAAYESSQKGSVHA